MSRISSPADRVSVGQQILCAGKNRDVQGRCGLTIRELLGTWEENAAGFTVGETVVGSVRSVDAVSYTHLMRSIRMSLRVRTSPAV